MNLYYITRDALYKFEIISENRHCYFVDNVNFKILLGISKHSPNNLISKTDKRIAFNFEYALLKFSRRNIYDD